MPRSAAALCLVACLLAAAAGAASAGAVAAEPRTWWHQSQSCPTFDGFLRTRLARDKYGWIEQRMHMLPRRRGVTLLLPVTAAISGPIFRQSPPILETTLDRLVKEVVLTRKFSSAGEMAIAGSARALSGSRVLFRLDGANRLIVQFEGWAGTQAVVEPIPITLPTSKGHAGVTMFALKPVDPPTAPAVATQPNGRRRLTKVINSCSGDPCPAYSTAPCSCGAKCTSMGGAASGGTEIFWACG